MRKHKLIELQKIVEEKIGSLKEEVEIGTNMKLNPLYIADQKKSLWQLQQLQIDISDEWSNSLYYFLLYPLL